MVSSGRLKRRTHLRSGAPLKRSPLRKRSKRQARRDRELAKARKIVLERSNGKCEVPGCSSDAQHVHHKRLRSQGRDDSPENLVAICLPHHERAHANPLWAAELGIVTRRTDPDPDEIALGKLLVEFNATEFCRAIGTSRGTEDIT